jgi:predicted DNA-binding protein
MKTSNNAGVDVRKPKGFHVRMPPELRKRIDDARKISGRSVNAELLARIEAGLDADEPELIAAIQSLKASVDALNRRLDEK